MLKNYKRGILPLFIGLGLLLAVLIPAANLAAESVQNLADIAPGAVPDAPPASPDGPAVVNGPNGLTYYNDRPTFETDFPGLPLEDFNDTLVAPGAILGCPSPFNNATANACFAAGAIIPGVNFQDIPFNDTTPGESPTGLVALGTGFFGNSSPTIAANTFTNTFEIVFDAPEPTAVGMDLVNYTSPQNLSIEIFDTSDASLGTTTGLGTNDEGSFFGVSSPVPIGRITIDAPNDSGDGAEGVDNFSFGVVAVGEPSIAMTKTVGTDSATCASSSSLNVPAGGGGTVVYYCYTVTNTGNVTLTTHDLDDDQLGSLLSGFPYALGPGQSVDTVTAGETFSAVITQTTTNVATWTAAIDTGGPGVTATSSATVTQNDPTSVSLSGITGDSVGITPVLLAILLAVIAGFGFVARRKMTT